MNAIEIKRAMERPFPVGKIHWRVGATSSDKSRGIALAYIDSRDVMKRLDDVLGPENWQRRYSQVVNGLVVCEVGVKFGEEWVWKADGAGKTDYEGEKGSMSNSFKRAAVNFGIARYLYAVSAPWVAIKPQGKSYVLAEIPPLPKWATPDGYDEIVAKKLDPFPDPFNEEDGNDIDPPITEDQVAELHKLLKQSGADKTKYLEYLRHTGKVRITSIEEIPAKMYDDAKAALVSKVEAKREQAEAQA